MFKVRALRVPMVHIQAPTEAAVEQIHEKQCENQLHGDYLHVNL